MLRPRRKVPDVIRRGLRLSLGLAICNSLGFLLANGFGDLLPKLSFNLVQGAKWASITVIVVSAPVTGRVAQVSLERTIGTIIGGMLGFFVYVFAHTVSAIRDEVFLVITTSLIGFVSVLLGRWLHLDYSTKLLAMTFVLVVMAAEHTSEAAIVAATRISGICFGVLCSVALSIVIFPKSANCEAVDSMVLALTDLSAFNGLAWSGGRSEGVPGSNGGESPAKKRKRKKTDAYYNIGTTEEYVDGMSDKNRRELECEKVLMDVYSKLGACEGFLKDAASEIYFTTIRGRWCFLPGIAWMQLGRWRLPTDEMLAVSTSVRHVARVLWSMHTLFQEGFDDPAMQSLLQHYPPDLLSQLQQTSYGAIQDVLDAFPNESSVKSEQLHRFVQGYQVLIKTADWHRRQVSRWVKAGLSQQPTSSAQQPAANEAENGTTLYSTSPNSDALLNGSGSEDEPSLAASIHRSYLALRGISPPLTIGGGASAKGTPSLPSRGSWTEPMQECTSSSGILPGAAQLPLFPDTAAGHLAEIRWQGFQFVMSQLVEELSDMHNAMSRLLLKLPHAVLPPSTVLRSSGDVGASDSYQPLLAAEDAAPALQRV